jgi:ABC-type phosphate/phosphonate transport system permease subunit
MNTDNEWLEEEMRAICKERKSKKKFNDNLLIFKMLIMIIVVFFCTVSLEAKPLSRISHVSKVVEDGVWFICPHCHMAQWQHVGNANWRGEFFCVNCGIKYE